MYGRIGVSGQAAGENDKTGEMSGFAQELFGWYSFN